RSSRTTPEPYSHVADLYSLLDTLDVEQAAFVGCSRGGAVAIDAVLTAPTRAWALVTVAAGLGGFEPTTEEEEWWEDAGAGIEEGVEAGGVRGRHDLPSAHVWAG